MSSFFSNIYLDFYKTIIKENRFLLLLSGTVNTIIISLFALIFSMIFGLILALVQEYTNAKNPINRICKIYINIIRGTPSVLLLMLIYYIIFRNFDISNILVSILAFGLEASAYISEVITSGIKSIDKGQYYAAESLGLNYFQINRYVILPQVLSNMMPALINNFIGIFKKSSVAGYIGVKDLTKAATIISSQTYDYFFPLTIIAIIYIVIVIELTKLANFFERRINKNV